MQLGGAFALAEVAPDQVPLQGLILCLECLILLFEVAVLLRELTCLSVAPILLAPGRSADDWVPEMLAHSPGSLPSLLQLGLVDLLLHVDRHDHHLQPQGTVCNGM